MRDSSVPRIEHRVAEYHEETLKALQDASPHQDDAARRARSENAARERGSSLEYVGLRWPVRRKVVARGFSFYALPEDEILAVWDALWRTSPNGDVLFAALDYYRPLVRKRASEELWPVAREWIGRVDNWAHADELSSLYSWILAAHPEEVYPQLTRWNESNDLWPRRISLVSLIHYSGKNAIFLPPERMLPLISNCIADHRYYVELGVGWVLRELAHVYPEEVTAYLEAHSAAMSTRAFARAIERHSPQERSRLRTARKVSGG
jgi:3-methyladenine DNA glycosylase AlkD